MFIHFPMHIPKLRMNPFSQCFLLGNPERKRLHTRFASPSWIWQGVTISVKPFTCATRDLPQYTRTERLYKSVGAWLIWSEPSAMWWPGISGRRQMWSRKAWKSVWLQYSERLLVKWQWRDIFALAIIQFNDSWVVLQVSRCNRSASLVGRHGFEISSLISN